MIPFSGLRPRSPKYRLKYRHILLLLAYRSERNKSQAKLAIEYTMEENINPGRHVLPMTQQLIDWELVRRTNPDEPDSKGHRILITDQGEQALANYFAKLNSISAPQYGI